MNVLCWPIDGAVTKSIRLFGASSNVVTVKFSSPKLHFVHATRLVYLGTVERLFPLQGMSY